MPASTNSFVISVPFGPSAEQTCGVRIGRSMAQRGWCIIWHCRPSISTTLAPNNALQLREIAPHRAPRQRLLIEHPARRRTGAPPAHEPAGRQSLDRRDRRCRRHHVAQVGHEHGRADLDRRVLGDSRRTRSRCPRRWQPSRTTRIGRSRGRARVAPTRPNRDQAASQRRFSSAQSRQLSPRLVTRVTERPRGDISAGLRRGWALATLLGDAGIGTRRHRRRRGSRR